MILITGGAGFIGLNLAWELAKRGKEILLFDPRPVQVPPFLADSWGNQVRQVAGDVLDLSFIFSLVKKYSIESIVHTAAIWESRGEDKSLYNAVRVNLEGTTNILEVGRIFSLRRITFISTVGVYYRQTGPWHEDLNLQVASYDDLSSTKKAGEHICSLYAKGYGLSVATIRLARVYGPAAHSRRNPMEIMIENAVAGKPSDLRHISRRSYVAPIYVKDCAKGVSLVHLAEALKHDIYNLGDGKFYNWSVIAQIVRKLIPDAEIRLGTGEPVVNFSPMSIDRIREEMGFTPDYDINQGVRAYIDWLREGKY